MSSYFQIEFSPVTLGVEDIWPDGDDPPSPSAEDAIAKMKEHNISAAGVINEWGLIPATFDVNGVPFR